MEGGKEEMLEASGGRGVVPVVLRVSLWWTRIGKNMEFARMRSVCLAIMRGRRGKIERNDNVPFCVAPRQR